MWPSPLVLLAWSAILLAVCLSLSALVAHRMSRWHRHPSYEKRLGILETDLIELLDKVDKLSVYAKKKYQRDAVRASRAKSNQANGEDGLPDSKTDPEGWKREMMKRHVLGGKQ